MYTSSYLKIALSAEIYGNFNYFVSRQLLGLINKD